MSNNTTNLDFNWNLAQGFGVYQNDAEFDVLNLVSSVNVSCGFHAGDPLTIRKALLKAKEHNLAIGALIGFNDLKGFGMNDMMLKPEETEAIVLYQIGALSSLAKSCNLEIEYVRTHGAMQKRASEDFEFSLAIANAIKKYDPWLTYYGLSGETLDKVGAEAEINVAHEIDITRIYNADGTIDFDANIVSNPEFTSKRLHYLVKNSEIKTKTGEVIKVKCDTIHYPIAAQGIKNILNRANEITKPSPVNYKNAVVSGWV